jgi:prepilin-type N-terminal cleavage/methylation domain-containing protein
MKFRAPQFPQSGFTMVEVAISLAIIGIALVAIIGVLPLGMNVQRDNREATVINQDATVFIEAIRNGSRGMDDLTNYVYAITNYWTEFNNSGNVIAGGGNANNGYTYNNSSVTWPVSSGSFAITNGLRIVGLLSTPEYAFVDVNGNLVPTNNLFSGGYSNHIVASVRSISGPAVEKPPQDNPIIHGDINNPAGDAFGYRIYCVNAPVAADTNVFFLPASQQAYSKQLAENLHELRLTFLWPVQPNGSIGAGRQTYRALVAGQILQTNSFGQPLYFYQSQSFTNAP